MTTRMERIERQQVRIKELEQELKYTKQELKDLQKLYNDLLASRKKAVNDRNVYYTWLLKIDAVFRKLKQFKYIWAKWNYIIEHRKKIEEEFNKSESFDE